MITAADLAIIEIFANVPHETLVRVSPWTALRTYHSGETVFFRGDPSDSMFMILGGSAEVILINGEGLRLSLETLGGGDIFGERSMLTGEPRRANVVACSDLSVAEMSRAHFERLLAICPQIHGNILRLMAQRLGRAASRHQNDEQEHKDLVTSLAGHQQRPEFDTFPGRSRWSEDLNCRIGTLARSSNHLLVTGEQGTGKKLVATLLHEQSPDPERPLFRLDCANPPPVLRETPTARSACKDPLLTEVAQEAALFGHEPDSAIYARGTRRGYLELAEGGDLILANIDFLTPAVQQLLARFAASGSYMRRGESRVRTGSVRLIATSARPPAELEAALEPSLAAELYRERIELRPLRERKRDIPVLARHFLGELNHKHQKNVLRLSEDAKNALIDHTWPLNGVELKQVMDRAVAVCSGPQIEADQIFLNISPFSSSGRFNLLQVPSIAAVAHSPLFPKIPKAVVAPLFLLTLLYTLLGPATDNLANKALWLLWWPALLLSVLLGARSWCSYCPLESLTAPLGLGTDLRFEPPRWLRRQGGWLAAALLLALLAAEEVTGMLHQPRATAALLLTLLCGAGLTTLFFGPRSWCRYLCPLGKLISQFSRTSLVALQSNMNICTSQCQVDDCIREKTCPMGLHPTAVNGSDSCILCCSCLRHCPHHSVRLNLRLPWLGILGRQRHELGAALIAVMLLGSVLALTLSPWPARPIGRGTGQALLAFAGIVGAFCAAALLASGGGQNRRRLAGFAISGPAYLPLGLAAMFNYYFRDLVEQGDRLPPLMVTTLGLDRWIDPAWVTPELGTLKALIPLGTLGGAALSLLLLKKLARRYALDLRSCRRHQALLSAATLACLILL